MKKKCINDVPVESLKGKRVLVRVDFNVPLDKDRNITDDARIRASLPTIKYLIDKGSKVILISHLGRPEGKPNPHFSLDVVAERLSKLLDKEVMFLPDCIGREVKEKVETLKEGDVALLENLRFYKEEKENDEGFAKELASLADIYVNDAFAASHRKHASVVGVAKFLPAYAGFLVAKEIDVLSSLLESPKMPFMAILGGAKVSDKIGVIKNLMNKVTTILIGGGMSYTFLKSQGYEIGDSLLEEDKIEVAKEILLDAEKKGIKILLPLDIVVANKFAEDADSRIVDAKNMPEGWMGMDIGPKTIELFKGELKGAKTIFWNGPLGVFEMEKFSNGTNSIARFLGELDAITVIGGGDSASAVRKAGVADKMTHISTGGGASLEFLEKGTLPGIEVLEDK